MEEKSKRICSNFWFYFLISTIVVLVGVFCALYFTKDSNNNAENVVNFSDLKSELNIDTIFNDAKYNINQIINKIGDENVVNVTDFGAVADDDIDDTQYINNAINSLSNGGVVFIPSGTFIINVSECVNLIDNVTLIGNGKTTIIKLADNQNELNNMIKVESKKNVNIYNFVVDGNRENQDNEITTQYGIFVSGSKNCNVANVYVKNTNGVGIHLYNSDYCTVYMCFSVGNKYHGFEIEQSDYCQLLNSYSSKNNRHGLLISPGEIGSEGSHYNTVQSSYFYDNNESGISFSLANDGLGDGLSTMNYIYNNIVFSNVYCGIQLYKVDYCIVENNLIADNNAMGIYIYASKNNSVKFNYLMNNSQSEQYSYSELFIEGSDVKDSCYSSIENNTIVINGETKADYAIYDNSTVGNYFSGNKITYSGKVGSMFIKTQIK